MGDGGDVQMRVSERRRAEDQELDLSCLCRAIAVRGVRKSFPTDRARKKEDPSYAKAIDCSHQIADVAR